MKFKNLFYNLFSEKKKPDFTEVKYVDSLADIPKDLEAVIYVVNDGTRNKWIVFRCPNNCGRRLEVNLMRTKFPFWVAKIKRKKVSLSPSVVVRDCGTHFWLTDSKVIEAKYSYED